MAPSYMWQGLQRNYQAISTWAAHELPTACQPAEGGKGERGGVSLGFLTGDLCRRFATPLPLEFRIGPLTTVQVVVNNTESPVLLMREHTGPQSTEIFRDLPIIQPHRQPERCPISTYSEFNLSLPSSSTFRSEQELSNPHPFQVPAPPTPPLYINSHISTLPCQGLDFFPSFSRPFTFYCPYIWPSLQTAGFWNL